MLRGNAKREGTLKADDLVKSIYLRKIDRYGENAENQLKHVRTRISVKVTSVEDSHHIEFPEPVTRAQLAYLLHELADRVCRGA